MKKSKQLELSFPNTHGGLRKGAGRKNRSGLRSHLTRPKLKIYEPVHVTLKLRPGLPNMRSKLAFKVLRHAVATARKKGFGVVHFAVLSNHVHLILESKENSLRRIFQSFEISYAKTLNKILERKGSVFHDRYHLRVLKTPTEVKHAITYVLTNYGKHRNKRFEVRIDPFSSAYGFLNWRKLFKAQLCFLHSDWSDNAIEAWYDEILSPAQTWLMIHGWKRASV